MKSCLDGIPSEKKLSWMGLNRVSSKKDGSLSYRVRMGEGTSARVRMGDRVRIVEHSDLLTADLGHRFDASGSR
jgi:hypothetical protein